MLKFLSFFSKLSFLSYTITPLSNYNQKKFITVLKSPHVNKTAQEQFEFRYYNCQCLVFSPKPLLFMLVLKRLFRFTFLGLRLELKVLLIPNNCKKKIIDPDIFLMQTRKNKILNVENKNNAELVKSEKIVKYIQTFDMFGEAQLREHYL